MQPSFISDKNFPAVLTPEHIPGDVFTWAQAHKKELRALLSTHGAILFRGFAIENIEDFERLASSATSDDWVAYLEATSPRDHVKGNTSTSTKYNNEQTIFFHNEKSYAGVWPYYLFFYCDLAPQSGGETPLSDCRAIYNSIPAEIREKFERKKLMYVRRFSNNLGIPWKEAFNVSNKGEMMRYCRDNYIDDLTWNADGTPTLKYIRKTALIHPLTGDKCWFNHGTFFNVNSLEPNLKEYFLSNFGQDQLPYNTYYGDGEDIEPEVIEILRNAYEEHSVDFPWQKNDVLMLDNMLLAHGRRPFQGPRNILVTMTEHLHYGDIEFI